MGYNGASIIKVFLTIKLPTVKFMLRYSKDLLQLSAFMFSDSSVNAMHQLLRQCLQKYYAKCYAYGGVSHITPA
jgi:transposase-like protein